MKQQRRWPHQRCLYVSTDDQAIYERAEEIAAEQGRSLAAVVAEALRDWVRRQLRNAT